MSLLKEIGLNLAQILLSKLNLFRVTEHDQGTTFSMNYIGSC